VARLRAGGLSQVRIARRLHTSRENVAILEYRACENIKAAKATVAALEQLSTDNEVWIPRGTSIFEAVSMILLRGDVLHVKLKRSADLLLAALRSKCKGKIHGHHLTAPVRITIEKNGAVRINQKATG